MKTLQISADTTIKQAMQKLNELGGKILFVVDEKERLLGTVTDGDIRRSIVNGINFNDRIEKVMHKNFTAVKSNMPNKENHIKQVMLETMLEQIPVIDNRGIIVDVIRWTDLLDKKKHLETRQLYPNQVVIMAGGKGERLDPFTRILPKPLIPIGEKPVIELIMEKFYQSGFHKFIYTLNHKKEYIKLFLKENNFPYHIDWVEEPDFLGTVGGLTLLKDKIKDTFFISNCDTLLEINFSDVLKWHKERKASITIIGSHNEVKIPFGVLELSNGRLGKIFEKPVHDVIINTGVYVIEPEVISSIPENQHIDMNELIEKVKKERIISVYPIYNGWLDIGQWEEYKQTVQKLGGIKDV